MSDTLARKILRTWYSVLSAYPSCATEWAVAETARQSGESREAVCAALAWTF